MYVQDFVIPLNREDLLKCPNSGEFYIREEYNVAEIEERVQAATVALNEEGIDFIVDHFPTYFSLIQKFKQCSQLVREKAWKTLRKGFDLVARGLQILLEDTSSMDSEIQSKMRNLTKMTLYLLVELMKMYQDQYIELKSNPLDGKIKKKQNKLLDEGWDWNSEKHSVLVEIHTFLQLPFKLLWEPPVVDEDFINLLANFCYNCLEDSGIGNANMKYIRETMFEILGLLIKNHLHGLSFCVKIVQLLKMNNHLVNTLAQGIVHLVKVCNCTNIVKEIVREIGDTDGDQLAADISGTRNLNLFLVQLAESIPETIIPAIDMLIAHLSGDSYSMRICVVGVLGEIVLNVLTKENLDENLKKMRDEYLDCLEEHIHDVNAFVRTKVLHIWQKLCIGKAIPISRTNRLLELVIGRLYDRSTNVKKQAVHLIKELLERNPFCGQLNISEIQTQLVQEKKKLESIENIHLSNSIEVEWKEIEMKLQELLKGIDDETDFDDLTDTEDASEEDMINIVGNYLCDGQYKQAISLLVKLKNEFYKTFKIKKENFCSETIIGILLQVFKEKKKLSLLSVAPDVQEKIEKHSKTIEYLESTLEFSELIDRALPIILTFLDSNVITDVLEAIHFFSAAYLFGFKKALEGVRKMLQLVFSKENSIKTAVSDAYKDIYFQKSGSERQQLMATVKNLSELILKLNFSQLDALEEVVRQWVKAEIIDKNCVQVLFEKFSMKLQGTGNDECWAALVLIRMVGSQEPKIIKSNISVLLNEGLKKHGSDNFLVAKETCKALQNLLPPKEQGKMIDHTLRYPKDHEIFKILHKLLIFGIWKTKDSYYIPMANEAINLVFGICDQPDEFCKNLIVEMHENILSRKRPVKNKNCIQGNILNNKNTDGSLLCEEEEKIISDYSDKEDASEKTQETDNSNEVFIVLFTRFISVLGQVASNYIMFLEGPVLDELKRRNQVEYERKLRKFEENKKFNVSLRKNKKGVTDCVVDRTLNETGVEDLEFNRVAADDIDTEEMKKKTENHIVIGEGLLAKFTPLILNVCKNPGKYNNKSLQNAALLTLSKFMQVSSVFCEENLQLLMTICEKSHIPERQENAMIALGALQYKFPNSLEPWTPRMYAMLQNSNPNVRYCSILVLTDLIINEMIKVRSHISNLALCIVDKEIKISRVARHFFREYSQKGNSLYNVLPSLISSLTQKDSSLPSEEFKIVMKYILALVTKEKQCEYLVEKLFQYFESATTERQWCDLAYCLSLLNYSDKGLKKILDNVKFFASKLYLADVYEAFCSIISDASKNPQKDKTLVNELNTIIKEYRDQCCKDKSVCLPIKKQCTQSTKKRVIRKKYLPSDSEEEEFERRSQRKRKKVYDKKDSNNEETDNESLLSDASSEKGIPERSRSGENKENYTTDDSNSVESECNKDTKTRTKTILKKKTRSKKAHAAKDSSEEEEKKDKTKDRWLRSSKKRK